MKRNFGSPSLSGAALGALGAVAGLVPCSHAQGSLSFVDRTQASGLAYQITGRAGVAVGDVDGDGFEDVVLTGSSIEGTQLFLNQGNGTFANASAARLPVDTPFASEAQMVDVDHDGDVDVLLARWYDALGLDAGFWWLENLGGGLFDHGAMTPNLARTPSLTASLATADLDKDGDLDVVFLTNNGPGFFLRNDGAAGFVDATSAFGASLSTPKRHWSGVLADLNNDGWTDLHVAIDGGFDYQVRNLGGVAFQDVSLEANVSNLGSDMGLAVGDPDMDGDLDLYSTNIGANVLYVNDGAGVFQDEASERGVRGQTSFPQPIGWGTLFVDLDNDQDEDLVYVVSNFVQGVWGQAFLNDGTGHFSEVTSAVGLGAALAGRALVAFDADRDGDLDLLSAGFFVTPLYFENRLDPGAPGVGDAHWLEIELHGRHDNAHGIGARVEVTVGGRRMLREVLSHVSMNTGASPRAHFGLGAFERAERVRVTWPDGKTQTFRDVPADRLIHVRQLAGPIQP